jgi:2-keto-4-pentenoate hydratase/2-oxohepta-3-ene-1,7-dioic acid hydratase in catechol pathway
MTAARQFPLCSFATAFVSRCNMSRRVKRLMRRSPEGLKFGPSYLKICVDDRLAVIIGTTLRRASEQQASAGIAGYAVGIDLSARDWQMNPRHPWKFDLFTGKGFDDSCPLGPKPVPARFVDPTNLELRLSVNGMVKQHSNTRDMIWSVTELVSLLSEHVALEPGDILLTGTPEGVGLASETYLRTGDRIEAEIDGLGKLSVEIVPDVATPRTPRAG